ncbi:hypothetical protein [Armatimonas sp.]|uniref:hypothetical protein n=1 Tax=Armatimonas sp. TaxID=1872638 RepID=UPI00286A1BB6|nr:hypothetical protein [Armatimonas sp.]
MRAILTSWLAVCLFLGAIPQAARVRLVCRISGQVMPMNTKQACCNVVASHDGQLVLQSPGCCELQITPAGSDAPPMVLSDTWPPIFTLPFYLALVPSVTFIAPPAALAPVRPHAPRGPPRSLSGPRAPPVFS